MLGKVIPTSRLARRCLMVDPVQAEEDDPYLYRLVRAIREMSRWWTLSRLRKMIPTSIGW